MVYAIGKMIFWVYFHLFYRLNICGVENIPKEGAVIICSNHVGSLDPMPITFALKRQVHYMAKKEIYKNPFYSWVLRQLGTFPVDRSITDMAAYKKAISLLKEGNVLGIFAQGTRVANAEAVAAKDGVSLFALKSKAAVIPVGIKSSYKLFSKVNVSFGKPLELGDFYDKHVNKELCSQVTEIIAENINALISGVV